MSRRAGAPQVQIWNASRQTLLAEQCTLALSGWARLRGLLGRSSLPEGQGMLLAPCASVHTLGMRFALDLIFVSDAGQVARVASRLRPNRAASHRGAFCVIELPAGTLAKTRTRPGDQLHLLASPDRPS